MSKMPDELLESAIIDGCGNGRFFISIVIPLSKEIISVLVLYYAVSQWNSYFNALIYLNNQKLYPLQLV
jgi:putative aldouronate transport system permease protein